MGLQIEMKVESRKGIGTEDGGVDRKMARCERLGLERF